MQTEKYQSFTPEKPCSELLPVEALAIINRWAKVKNRFYYDDLNDIYSIKDSKISEWLKNGEIIATKIITRKSLAFQGMQKAIAIGGKDLEWLHYDSWHDYLTEKENAYYKLIHDLTGCGCDEFYVPYPEDVCDAWKEALKSKIEQYNSAFETYEVECKKRQPIIKEYNSQVNQHKQDEEKAAKSWAKENKVKISRSNSGKNVRKDWLKRLKKQGFKFSIPKPVNPYPHKLQAPQKVQYPDKTYLLTWQTYLPGSLPEIEELLEWVRSVLDYDIDSWDIDEDFVCFNFDQELRKQILERVKLEVLDTFKDILAGKYQNASEIHNQLTGYEIEYKEAIGMRSWFSFNRCVHGSFGKWHEINLSPTGTWLIEFQSKINPDITFHSPYSRNFDLDKSSLPKVDSTQKNFGREINREEKKNYPIEELIKILDFEIADFCCELKQYKPTRISKIPDEDDESDFFF